MDTTVNRMRRKTSTERVFETFKTVANVMGNIAIRFE